MSHIKLQFKKDFPNDDIIKSWQDIFPIPDLVIRKDALTKVVVISFDGTYDHVMDFYERMTKQWGEINLFSIMDDLGESNFQIQLNDGSSSFSSSSTSYVFLKIPLKTLYKLFLAGGFDKEYIRFSLSDFDKYDVVLDNSISEEYLDKIMAEEVSK